MGEIIPPRIYFHHIVVTSSIDEPSSYLEEVCCNALMEESSFWETILFLGVHIYLFRDKNRLRFAKCRFIEIPNRSLVLVEALSSRRGSAGFWVAEVPLLLDGLKKMKYIRKSLWPYSKELPLYLVEQGILSFLRKGSYNKTIIIWWGTF